MLPDTIKLFNVLYAVLLAMFGAHVRVLLACGTTRTRYMITEYIISAFAGLITMYIVHSTDKVTGELELAFIAMSGFCARDILSFFSSCFIGKIKNLFTTNKK